MRWVKVNAELINDWHVQMLAPNEFKRAFFQALDGNGGPLEKWVKRHDGRLPRSEWERRRTEVYFRDDYTCQYCGERGGKLECDHVVPLARGGSNDISNLVTACFKCNRSKRDKTPEEWRNAHVQRQEFREVPALQGPLTAMDQAL
jgi:5-methylcytosine-specific restriction endonuclease McrA